MPTFDHILCLWYNPGMKLWMKYVIGVIIGIVAALILPVNSVQGQAVLDFISDIVIRFGRYMLIPVLFFSVATAFYKLREEKKTLKVMGWTFGTIAVTSIFLAVVGLVSALIALLPRLPISIEKVKETATLDFKSLLTQLFPYSGFEVLKEGAYILPVFIIAALLGGAFSSERMYGKPGVNFFDSMSHVCYRVMSFLTEIFSVGMIAVVCKWTIEFVMLQKLKIFMPLIILLSVDLALVAFLFYPIVTSIICKEKRVWKILYASICPFLVAFFSGDTNLTLGLNMRHGKESLGIRRRVNASVYPLFSIFGRGGAALVTTVCFIQILRSYILLDTSLTPLMCLWIVGFALLLSFALPNHPVGGPFIAITVMCAAYGPSFETGYLLIKDAAPIICAFAAGFDMLTAMFGTFVVAYKTECISPVEVKKFI